MMTPPGTRALAFASRWLDAATVARVFEPLVADWQRELVEARHEGLRQHARAMVSGAFAFARSLARCAVTRGRLPSSRAIGVGVGAFIAAVALAKMGLLLVAVQAGRTIDPASIQTQGYLLSTAVLVVPVAMLPAVFMLRRDPRSTVRHAVAAIALGAALTATVVLFTSPEALNRYFSTFEVSEREYQRALANDRAGRYQYPGTVYRQLRGETTAEQRRESHQRFEAWLAQQQAKDSPLTWPQWLSRFQPVVLAGLFGVMGWTLAGLGAASLPRAAGWWLLMYLATLAFGGALTRIPALGTVRPPAWSALAMFALLTLALLWAGRRNRQIDREIPNSPNR